MAATQAYTDTKLSKLGTLSQPFPLSPDVGQEGCVSAQQFDHSVLGSQLSC